MLEKATSKRYPVLFVFGSVYVCVCVGGLPFLKKLVFFGENIHNIKFMLFTVFKYTIQYYVYSFCCAAINTNPFPELIFSSHKTETIYSLNNSSFFSFLYHGNHHSTSVSMILTTVISHTNEIIEYLSFSDLLILFSIMSSRFIQIVAY